MVSCRRWSTRAGGELAYGMLFTERGLWIPACAGMTECMSVEWGYVMGVVRTVGSRLRGNDGGGGWLRAILMAMTGGRWARALKPHIWEKNLVVGAAGFEPATSWSQTTRATAAPRPDGSIVRRGVMGWVQLVFWGDHRLRGLTGEDTGDVAVGEVGGPLAGLLAGAC